MFKYKKTCIGIWLSALLIVILSPDPRVISTNYNLTFFDYLLILIIFGGIIKVCFFNNLDKNE